jgi:hypothetical protein
MQGASNRLAQLLCQALYRHTVHWGIIPYSGLPPCNGGRLQPFHAAPRRDSVLAKDRHRLTVQQASSRFHAPLVAGVSRKRRASNANQFW